MGRVWSFSWNSVNDMLVVLASLSLQDAPKHAGAAAMIMCVALTAVDGDTVRCDGQLMRLLGGGVPFVSGIDAPAIGSHAKCIKERKLALIAKARLRELLDARGLQIEIKGYDNTPKHRPLINIYREDRQEVGAILRREGFARDWKPHRRNDWCSN